MLEHAQETVVVDRHSRPGQISVETGEIAEATMSQTRFPERVGQVSGCVADSAACEGQITHVLAGEELYDHVLEFEGEFLEAVLFNGGVRFCGVVFFCGGGFFDLLLQFERSPDWASHCYYVGTGRVVEGVSYAGAVFRIRDEPLRGK